MVLSRRFGENLNLFHNFGQPFTGEAGAKIVEGFTFDQQRTNTAHTLEGVVSLLEVGCEARAKPFRTRPLVSCGGMSVANGCCN